VCFARRRGAKRRAAGDAEKLGPEGVPGSVKPMPGSQPGSLPLSPAHAPSSDRGGNGGGAAAGAGGMRPWAGSGTLYSSASGTGAGALSARAALAGGADSLGPHTEPARLSALFAGRESPFDQEQARPRACASLPRGCAAQHELRRVGRRWVSALTRRDIDASHLGREASSTLISWWSLSGLASEGSGAGPRVPAPAEFSARARARRARGARRPRGRSRARGRRACSRGASRPSTRSRRGPRACLLSARGDAPWHEAAANVEEM
jgi:hypothetical protein